MSSSYTPKQETLRRYYWHQYFVSLREKKDMLAFHFHKLARAEEANKKRARKFVAGQFELPY